MAERNLPSPEFLRKILRYDPKTGLLYWRPRTADMFTSDAHCRSWNTRYANKEAFTAAVQGKYFAGSVGGVKLRSQRVIWAMEYGYWPKWSIDHIDGNTRNNRLENLRDVPQSTNSRNCKTPKSNVSGRCGVRWYAPRGKWVARIKYQFKDIHLGYFSEKSDAIEARIAAEKRYGFHENHGRR